MIKDIKKYVIESHQRSLSYYININQKNSRHALFGKDLNDIFNIKKELIISSNNNINILFEAVSKYDFMIVLTDENGCILNVTRNKNVLSEECLSVFTPGVFINESSIGTTAFGIALHEKIPVKITLNQHFIEYFHNIISYAVPIVINDKQIGVLGLLGYDDNNNLLNLLVSIVKSTEEHILYKNYILKNNNLLSLIDNLDIGIILSDLDGNITYTNNNANEVIDLNNKSTNNINDILNVDENNKVINNENNEYILNIKDSYYKVKIYRNNNVEEIIYIIQDMEYSIDNSENMTLDYIEKEHILKVLKQNDSNITVTAKILGIARNTLYRKLDKYKIDCSVLEQCSEMER